MSQKIDGKIWVSGGLVKASILDSDPCPPAPPEVPVPFWTNFNGQSEIL